MRTTHELLLILKEQVSNNVEDDDYGLCVSVWTVFFDGKITRREEIKLSSYVDDNVPKKGTQSSGYWWCPTKKRPRIIWLNKHLKLTNETR